MGQLFPLLVGVSKVVSSSGGRCKIKKNNSFLVMSAFPVRYNTWTTSENDR